MEHVDPIDDLARRLSAFHISARLQRLYEPDEPCSQDQPPSSTEIPISPTRDVHSSTQSDTVVAAKPQRASRLPTPRPGSRPCWEPPICDYSWFETFLEAQKELASRDGNKEIAWRTDIMDLFVEERLLVGWYIPWINANLHDARERDDLNEDSFWRQLQEQLTNDMSDLMRERTHTRNRYEKIQGDEWEIQGRVLDICKEKDPTFGGKYHYYRWR